MPTFCRHNRFLHNCPICSREQAGESGGAVASGGARASRERPVAPGTTSARSGGVRVRRLARVADDGYLSRLVPGLKSSADAERLAQELAFSATRLRQLAAAPPGLYAEVASEGDLEERTWLAFLIAYLGPLEAEDPFASVRSLARPWTAGASLALEEAAVGPRGAHDPARGTRTIEVYRQWVGRAGSQARAFTGDAAWSRERRFARTYERLALPGLPRDARFDLMVTLGRLGVYELQAGALGLGGTNGVTLAAKRVLGIGDPLLLERRASELAQACELPLDALDLALYNWGGNERSSGGLSPGAEPDAGALRAARTALGI